MFLKKRIDEEEGDEKEKEEEEEREDELNGRTRQMERSDVKPSKTQ